MIVEKLNCSCDIVLESCKVHYLGIFVLFNIYWSLFLYDEDRWTRWDWDKSHYFMYTFHVYSCLKKITMFFFISSHLNFFHVPSYRRQKELRTRFQNQDLLQYLIPSVPSDPTPPMMLLQTTDRGSWILLTILSLSKPQHCFKIHYWSPPTPHRQGTAKHGRAGQGTAGQNEGQNWGLLPPASSIRELSSAGRKALPSLSLPLAPSPSLS